MVTLDLLQPKLGSLGTMSMAMSSLSVFLFVCITVFSALLWRKNVYVGKLCRYGASQKPFEFGLDQTMVIILISLMNKLLYVPISLKRYQIGI